MSFARLVPSHDRVVDGRLVAAGVGFFADEAWKVIHPWAPSSEVKALLPSAERKLKKPLLVHPRVPTASAHAAAPRAEEEEDDDDDAAGVPVDERVAVEVDVPGLLTLPGPDDTEVGLRPSFDVELAFINFLRAVMLCSFRQVRLCASDVPVKLCRGSGGS